jgi:hypothetical protein
MSNGQDPSVITQQGGQQQALATQEEPLEQETNLYQTLRGIDPLELRNEILRNRAEKQVYMNADSANAADLMSRVYAGDMTYAQAVATSKTMLTTPMRTLDNMLFDKNKTRRDFDKWFEQNSNKLNRTETAYFFNRMDRKARQEASTATAGAKVAKLTEQNTDHFYNAKDIYQSISFDIETTIEGATDATGEVGKALEYVTEHISGELKSQSAHGSIEPLQRKIYLISRNIPAKKMLEAKGFMINGVWTPIPEMVKDPDSVRDIWFKMTMDNLKKARTTLRKMNQYTEEAPAAQEPDPYNIFQHIE